MKKCPYCAEEIQDEAIVCRYCGRDITNFKNKQKISGIKERQHQNSYNSSAWKQGAKLAFVFAILGAIGLYLRNPNFSTIYFIDLLVGFVFWWLIISLWIMLWRWLGQKDYGRLIAGIVLIVLSISAVFGFSFVQNLYPISKSKSSEESTPSQSSVVAAINTTVATRKIPLLSPPLTDISECKHWANVSLDDVDKAVCVYGVVYALDVNDLRKPNQTSCPYPFNDPEINCNTLIEFSPSTGGVFDVATSFYLITDIYDVKVGDCVLAIDVVSRHEGLGESIPPFPVMFTVKNLFSCPQSLIP